MKRRSFMRSAAVAAAPTVVPASVLGRNGRMGPSERVTIGLAGAVGKGYDLMWDFHSQCRDEVQFVAIADPDTKHVERGRRLAEKNWGEGCTTYRDFRAFCARSDLAAVVVAIPDHWHALAALEAIRSGKDVYGEKPLTHLSFVSDALKRPLSWDSRKEEVPGDPEASRLLNRLEYRGDWSLDS